MSKPEPLILPNGDVVLPVGSEQTGWSSRRVASSDPDYVEAFAEVQRLQREQAGVPGWWYVVSVLIPIVGVVLALVALTRSKVGPAFALLGAAVVSFLIVTALVG